jgi:hypothetical protein
VTVKHYIPVFCLGVMLGMELKKTFTERLPFIADFQHRLRLMWTGDMVGWVPMSEEDEDDD